MKRTGAWGCVLLLGLCWALNDQLGPLYYEPSSLLNLAGKACGLFRPLLLLLLLESFRGSPHKKRLVLGLGGGCLFLGLGALLVNLFTAASFMAPVYLYDYFYVLAGLLFVEGIAAINKKEASRGQAAFTLLLGAVLLFSLIRPVLFTGGSGALYSRFTEKTADALWGFCAYGLLPSVFVVGKGLPFLLLGWIGYRLSRKDYCKLLGIYAAASLIAGALQFEAGIDLTALLGADFCNYGAVCYALAVPFILLSVKRQPAPQIGSAS